MAQYANIQTHAARCGKDAASVFQARVFSTSSQEGSIRSSHSQVEVFLPSGSAWQIETSVVDKVNNRKEKLLHISSEGNKPE